MNRHTDTLFEVFETDKSAHFAKYIGATTAYPTLFVVGSPGDPADSGLSRFLRAAISQSETSEELIGAVQDLSETFSSAAAELGQSVDGKGHMATLRGAGELLKATEEALREEHRVIEAITSAAIGGRVDNEDDDVMTELVMTELVAQCIGLEISNPFEGTPDGYGYEVSFC